MKAFPHNFSNLLIRRYPCTFVSNKEDYYFASPGLKISLQVLPDSFIFTYSKTLFLNISPEKTYGLEKPQRSQKTAVYTLQTIYVFFIFWPMIMQIISYFPVYLRRHLVSNDSCEYAILVNIRIVSVYFWMQLLLSVYSRSLSAYILVSYVIQHFA